MYFLLKTYFINLSLIFFPGNSSWRVGGGLLSWKSKQEGGGGGLLSWKFRQEGGLVLEEIQVRGEVKNNPIHQGVWIVSGISQWNFFFH